MERRCENCGQPALAGDKVCWHCGWRLIEGDEAEGNLEVVSARQGWQQPAGLSALLVYAGLTLLVIALTLLVMGWLGRRPLIKGGPAVDERGRRQVITAADASFVIDLPADWSWLDGTNRQQAPALAALLESDILYPAAALPLAEELTDLTVILVAATPAVSDKEAFAIVASSRDLGLLSPASIARYLREAEFNNALVLEVGGDGPDDDGRVTISAEVLAEEDAELLRCQQVVVLGEAMGWLVSACSVSQHYLEYEAILASILTSFQLLPDN